MLRQVRPRGTSRALLSASLPDSPSSTSTQATFSTRRPRRTNDKTEEAREATTVACPTIKLADEAVAQVSAHATRQQQQASPSSSTSSSSPVPSTSATTLDERHHMPVPIANLMESPTELDLHAAFANDRALLELGGSIQSEREVYKRLAKVPNLYFAKRSASKEAEPFPLGHSSDWPSTTTRPPNEASAPLARFLNQRKPPYQSQQLGPYNPALPPAAQEHLGNVAHLQPPLPSAPATSLPLSTDLRAIAPFGLAGESTSTPSPWPSSSAIRQERLPQLGGFLANKAKIFLDAASTQAAWRTALLSLQARGQLPSSRLAALIAEANDIASRPIATADDVSALHHLLPGGSEAYKVVVIKAMVPGGEEKKRRPSRRGKRTSIGGVEDLQRELETALSGSSASSGDSSKLSGILDILTRTIKSALGREAVNVKVHSIDGAPIDVTPAPESARKEQAATSYAPDAEEQAALIKFKLVKGQLDLIKRFQPIISDLLRTGLHPTTHIPLNRSILIEQRSMARQAQRKMRSLYIRVESLARSFLTHNPEATEKLREDVRSLAEMTAKRESTTIEEEAKMVEVDKACARLMRANLSGAVSLREARAESLGLQVKKRSIGLMNTVRWQRHKRKKHQRLKKQKRAESETKKEEARARKDRMKAFRENTKKT